MINAVYSKARTSRSKWKGVLEAILQDFTDGKFADGSQFYTLEQLCVKYDISDITGRRVFSELKNRGLITSNGRRGTIITGQTVTQDVYMCLPNMYFDSGAGGVARYHSFQQLFAGFTTDGYPRLFRVIPISLGFLLNNLTGFAEKHVIVSAEAVVDFSQSPGVLDLALLRQLGDTVNPIIFDSFGGIPGVTQVGVDFYRGIRKVVGYLVERGHSRIAYFTHDVNDLWLRPRLRGFIDGLFDVGLRFDPALLLMTNNLDMEENLQALTTLLDRPDRPTALVCASDSRAMIVLEYCRTHGIAVPEHLAVTGFDNTPESSLVWAPLTTVDGMEAQIGKKVLDLLVKRQTGKLKEPLEVLIDPEFIPRVSG